MWLTAVLLGITLCLVLSWFRQRQRQLQLLKELGIPGPEPSFFLGNLAAFKDEGPHLTWRKWKKKYGKTYGYYEGPNPVIVTSDVDIIKTILIKEFNKFHSRKSFPLQDPEEKHVDMVGARGERWRRLRAISSPSFSARRMKEMSPLINKCVDDFMDIMQTRCATSEPFDIHRDLQRLTLDVIGCCAFGMDVSSLKNEDDIFLEKCREVFDRFEKKTGPFNLVAPIAFMFPSLAKLLRAVLFVFVTPVRNWFFDAAARIISSRRNEKDPTRVDFIQLMLDAEQSEGPIKDSELTASLEPDREDDTTSPPGAPTPTPARKPSSPGRPKKGMTIEEMQSQCMLFLLAGYETTSTALAFATFELSRHLDIQARLQKEVEMYFPNKSELPNYETVHKLPYLDMIMRETLRLHPIGQVASTRQCFEPTTINGQFFPKGISIQIHMADVHFDPELWGPEDPNEFVPERFSPERRDKLDTMAWIPFGGGPRNCIGMRFALMEAKIALVRLLQKFTLRSCDKTQNPIPVKKNAVQSPSEGVWVIIEERSR